MDAGGRSDNEGETSMRTVGPEDCLQPPLTGPCRASFRSYYFNRKSRKCETFIWSGCGGNNNRWGSQCAQYVGGICGSFIQGVPFKKKFCISYTRRRNLRTIVKHWVRLSVYTTVYFTFRRFTLHVSIHSSVIFRCIQILKKCWFLVVFWYVVFFLFLMFLFLSLLVVNYWLLVLSASSLVYCLFV